MKAIDQADQTVYLIEFQLIYVEPIHYSMDAIAMKIGISVSALHHHMARINRYIRAIQSIMKERERILREKSSFKVKMKT